jgi:hypothetical protein
MSAMAFDTLKTSKDLTAAGFEPAQAEALANVIATSLTSGVATREDVAKLDGKIDSAVSRLDGKIESVRAELKGDIQLLKWMTGASIGLTTAVLLRLLLATP